MKQEEIQERWKKLLSCTRLNDLKKGFKTKECEDKSDPRNPFQRDCDRITYSYPFRRMQNKTQVIPRPEIDFIHTRLTHSLEVATVGRSMGMLLERFLMDGDHLHKEYEKGSLSATVAAACLAHDIGNPPFGHCGEDSISNYYRFDEGLKKIYEHFVGDANPKPQCSFIQYDPLTPNDTLKCMDLMRFEGNAMGFRILAKYNGEGLNLTCATLATFSKYPRQSYIEGDSYFDKDRWAKGASQKKYGFFCDDAADFKLVAEEVGLIPFENAPDHALAWHRHPLAFLMEAADDICYRVIDLEDGFRLGLIPFKAFEKDLTELAMKDSRFDKEVLERHRGNKDEKKVFSYLRSLSINYLIHEVMKIYKSNFVDIMSGAFDEELIAKIPAYALLNKLKTDYVRPYVYNWKEVLEIEAAGFEILRKILHEFTEASDLCNECPEISQSAKAKKFDQLLPEEFKRNGEDIFTRYINIACYVAGMSDTYALDMYRKITGISMR